MIFSHATNRNYDEQSNISQDNLKISRKYKSK